jgi:hypothetical protein
MILLGNQAIQPYKMKQEESKLEEGGEQVLLTVMKNFDETPAW